MQDSKNLQIKVLVNDKPIVMNPFVQDIVKNVVLALVQSLKLEQESETIEMKLTKS